MRETRKQLKLTMLERLICADILEFADWGDSLQRCTPRGFEMVPRASSAVSIKGNNKARRQIHLAQGQGSIGGPCTVPPRSLSKKRQTVQRQVQPMSERKTGTPIRIPAPYRSP